MKYESYLEMPREPKSKDKKIWQDYFKKFQKQLEKLFCLFYREHYRSRRIFCVFRLVFCIESNYEGCICRFWNDTGYYACMYSGLHFQCGDYDIFYAEIYAVKTQRVSVVLCTWNEAA